MSRLTIRRSLMLAIVAAALCLAVWTLRVQIAEVALAGGMLRAFMHKQLGVKRRPKSSWSSLGRTAALMFAAWNSRWLKPSAFTAKVHAAADGERFDCDGNRY